MVEGDLPHVGDEPVCQLLAPRLQGEVAHAVPLRQLPGELKGQQGFPRAGVAAQQDKVTQLQEQTIKSRDES